MQFNNDSFVGNTSFNFSNSTNGFDGKNSEVMSEINIENRVNLIDGQLEKEKETSPYTIANRDWKDVQLVTKAKEGVRGAWFYTNLKRGRMVVKGQEGAEEQLMGNIFLRSMGIPAPDSKIVKCLSEEGQQLSFHGEKKGLNARKPFTHYIVMECVNGPAYKDLYESAENIQMVKNNLINLGELAIYDLVLGNFDRFQLDSMSFNAGNIMFEKGVLRPIDTDCTSPEKEDKLGITKLILKKIVNGNETYAEKIAQKLENNFPGGMKEGMISRKKIKEGMEKAILKIIELCNNMNEQKKGFLASFIERGGETPEFPPHLEELLLHVKNCKK